MFNSLPRGGGGVGGARPECGSGHGAATDGRASGDVSWVWLHFAMIFLENPLETRRNVEKIRENHRKVKVFWVFLMIFGLLRTARCATTAWRRAARPPCRCNRGVFGLLSSWEARQVYRELMDRDQEAEVHMYMTYHVRILSSIMGELLIYISIISYIYHLYHIYTYNIYILYDIKKKE